MLGIQFLGAAGTVTGSKYLVTVDEQQFLIDCGVFQGYKALRLQNWDVPPFDPKSLRAVMLTHAHIDHSGYLPVLVKRGFHGPIYSSQATFELCRILLKDSAKLAEEDAERANRYGYTKHKPARPLFTEKDAEEALSLFVPQEVHKLLNITNALSVEYIRAGHILGATSIRITACGRTVVFSGDLGRENDDIMSPPETFDHADYIVVESTYGDKRHPETDATDELGDIIGRTIKRGGTVVIPAFAVGRTQSLLLSIDELKRSGRIPQQLPVFLNSPMAQDVTVLYRQFRTEHRLSSARSSKLKTAAKYVASIEESKDLNLSDEPKIIIAGSGMATGGRVIHHIAAFGPSPKNTIVLAGFQAGGTRGAALLAGAKEVKIHGAYVPIRAEIVGMDNMSAHADADGIMRWLSNFKNPPRQAFVTHGEPAAADALRLRIQDELKWRVIVPQHMQKVIL